MPQFLQGFLAKILLILGVTAPAAQPAVVSEPPPAAVAETTTEEPKVIIQEKTVIKDISKEKVLEYESKLISLQAQLNQVKNQFGKTYREIQEGGSADGLITRFYPHDGDSPENLDSLSISGNNRSPLIGSKIRIAKQEHSAAIGYTTLSTQDYFTDSKGWVRNLGIRLEKDSAGKSKYFYKIYFVDDEVNLVFLIERICPHIGS